MWKTYSLRNQLLIPILACVAVTQVSLIAVFGWMAIQLQVREINGRIERVTETIAKSNFPITDAVLSQMRGLTGAEFIWLGEEGENLGSTLPGAIVDREWIHSIPLRASAGEWNQKSIVWEGQTYFAMAIARRDLSELRAGRLIVLFPQAKFVSQQWQAIRPVLWLGALSIAVTGSIVLWLATRVTRPISELRNQVEKIADGQFQALPIDSTTEEVRELAVAVHGMAEKVAAYETTIRATERVRLWALLRSGIAHQLRNAMTGAKMALEIHQAECSQGTEGESIKVALQQFKIMEQQLQQFLRSPDEVQLKLQPVDVRQLLESCRTLLLPLAVHRGVALEFEYPVALRVVQGDFDSLQQLLLNLINNAMDAASSAVGMGPRPEKKTASSENPGPDGPRVVVRTAEEPPWIAIQVWDNGQGPQPEMVPQLFEPFGTDKVGGVGLGLWMAKQIAGQHAATIQWRRSDQRTCFEVRLPGEDSNVDE